MIRCGTSGWAHPDWDTIVFPRIKPRGFHPLEFLSHHFDFLEIDTANGRLPRPELSRVWLKMTAHKPEFVFTAVLAEPFTTAKQLEPEAVQRYKEGLWPLLLANKIGCLLMRFPWSFRFNKENRDFLIAMRRTFHEFPLAAELRHESWTYDEALGVLMDHRVGFCNIDQPAGLRATPAKSWITAPVGYVRLLGRGGTDWTNDEAAADYLYSSMELAKWLPRIDRLGVHTTNTYVVMANSRQGKAVVNALQLNAMLRDCSSAPKRRPGRAIENVIPFQPQHQLRA